jgi:hypothetical protein
MGFARIALFPLADFQSTNILEPSYHHTLYIIGTEPAFKQLSKML